MKQVLVGVLIVASCGGSDPATSDAPPSLDAAAEKEVGQLLIAEGSMDGSDQTIAFAAFGPDRDTIVTSRDDGPCHVEQRTRVLTTPVGAGAVSISGPSGTLALPSSMNQYFAMVPGLKYTGGEALTFSATGDVVPAFSTVITFPANVTVTSPVPTAVHKSGLMATWMPTTGSVVIRLTHFPGNSQGNFVNCTFDGSSGSGTVPSTALAELVSGKNASLTIATATELQSTAGAYAIQAEALFIGQQTQVPVLP
jgi:hypothetical protein